MFGVRPGILRFECHALRILKPVLFGRCSPPSDSRRKSLASSAMAVTESYGRCGPLPGRLPVSHGDPQRRFALLKKHTDE